LGKPFLKAMDSKEVFGCNYLVLKPEEASVVDLGSLLFSSKLSNRRFIECTEEVEARDFRQRWLLFTSVVLQILLLATRNSLKKLGDMLELWLNRLSCNGGLIGLFLNFLRGKSIAIIIHGIISFLITNFHQVLSFSIKLQDISINGKFSK